MGENKKNKNQKGEEVEPGGEDGEAEDVAHQPEEGHRGGEHANYPPPAQYITWIQKNFFVANVTNVGQS